MRYISDTEAKQGLAAVLDAAQLGPVMIRHEERDVAVVLSATEYEKLRRLNVEEFLRVCDRIGAEAKARGMNESVLNELLND